MYKLFITALLATLFACEETKMSEDEAWNRVGKFRNAEQADSLGEALDYYIDHFEEGVHLTEATALKDAFDAERAEWASVSRRGCTLQQVDEYLYRHPSGFFRQQVLEAIDSLTFREALEKNSVKALEEYIENFPDGRFVRKAQAMIDGTEERSVTSDERRSIVQLIERHFGYMVAEDDDIVSTVAENLSCYIGKQNCTADDVVAYMNHVNADYKEKLMETSNFDIRKVMAADISMFNVQFRLVETIEPEDTLKRQERQFKGTAIVNNHMKITSLILE